MEGLLQPGREEFRHQGERGADETLHVAGAPAIEPVIGKPRLEGR